MFCFSCLNSTSSPKKLLISKATCCQTATTTGNINLKLPYGNLNFTENCIFPYFFDKKSFFEAKRQLLDRGKIQVIQYTASRMVAIRQPLACAKSLALIIMLDPEVTITHIRENIRQKIQDAGYPTIEKFAYENGLTKSTITRAINGSRNPRLITLIEIANALNINLSELLDLHQIEHNQGKKSKTSNHKK